MTESSPELRALLRQARTAYSPSRSELEAVLVELQAHGAVNTPPSSGAAFWSHAPRWLGLGVIAVAVGAAFYLQKPETTVSPAAPPPSPPITSASTPPPTAAAETPRTDAAAQAPPLEPSSAVPRRTRRAARTSGAVTRAEVSQRQAQANAANMPAAAESAPERARAQSVGTNTSPAEPSAAAETVPKPNSAPDTLLVELPLLQSAQAALNQGRAADALALLERHTMRYPKGVLRQKRIAAQVSAFCMLGRIREATQLAQQLARIAPASPHLAKLHNSCVR